MWFLFLLVEEGDLHVLSKRGTYARQGQPNDVLRMPAVNHHVPRIPVETLKTRERDLRTKDGGVIELTFVQLLYPLVMKWE